MEPLFTVKHQNNEDEFVRFNRAVAAKFGRKKLALIFVNIMLLCAIFAAVSIMMFTDNMPDIILFFFIALGVYMNYAYTFGMDRRARKLYQQSKVTKGVVNEYDFFDEYFVNRNINGQGTMAYDKLFKVIETRTHFYLMLSKVQGYTIAKAEAPANFTEFMQKKIDEYNLKA